MKGMAIVYKAGKWAGGGGRPIGGGSGKRINSWCFPGKGGGGRRCLGKEGLEPA